MTEPSRRPPVPGPGPDGHVREETQAGPGGPPGEGPEDPAVESTARFAELAGRPVAEHVEAFEAEHERLQAELGAIDRL